MRELIERTSVSRESIHYYTREGMLPDIEKPSPNQAIYNETHVERILFIKKLQERHYLPIPIIKKILNRQGDAPFDENLMDIKSDYFMTADQFLPMEIEGETEFKRITGVSSDRLSDFENYGIISFKERSGKKVYSHESIKIGKLIGDMRRRGLSHEKGFPRTGLKELQELMQPAFDHFRQMYKTHMKNATYSPEEANSLNHSAVELISLFSYYMSRMQLKDIVSEHQIPDEWEAGQDR